MGELPPVEQGAASDKQRERLARWLAEWELDRALREEEVDRSGAAPKRVRDGDTSGSREKEGGRNGKPFRSAPGGDDADPAPGQIRLLPPSMPGAGERPVYVLVLAAEGTNGFVLVPFGRFAGPAVPAELLTGRDEPFLRVLCVWNVIRLTADSARRTWLAGSVDDEELGTALAVYRHETEGVDLADNVADRIGPQLSHPFDPRYIYLREEADRLRRLDESARCGTRRFIYDRQDEDRVLPKAAEDREEYGED